MGKVNLEETSANLETILNRIADSLTRTRKHSFMLHIPYAECRAYSLCCTYPGTDTRHMLVIGHVPADSSSRIASVRVSESRPFAKPLLLLAVALANNKTAQSKTTWQNNAKQDNKLPKA